MFDWITDLFADTAADTAVDAVAADGILGVSSAVAEETTTGGFLDGLSWGDAKDVGKSVLGAGVKTFGGGETSGTRGVSRRPSSIGLNFNSTDRMSAASMPSPAKTSNYDEFYSQWTTRMRGLAGR